MAVAVATILGAGPVQAVTITMAANELALITAIQAVNQLPDCSDQVVNLGDGITPFVVGISTPLPAITCPHLTIQGVGTPGYGASLSYFGYGSALPICGIESTVPITVQDLTISGLRNSGNAAGLCGSFDAVRRMDLHGNDNGIFVTGPSGVIGGGSVDADRNYIYNNSWVGGGDGIQVQPGASAEIARNWIGTLDGENSLGNANGITLSGDPSTVHDNVISGNSSAGIQVQSSGHRITTNKIGTNDAGTGYLDNSWGILIATGADGTTIDDNVISGNVQFGIEVSGDGTSITRNRIGTNFDGSVLVLNGEGIVVSSTSGTSIDGNIISATNSGVTVYGSASITNNLIGVDATGKIGLGGPQGVYAYGASVLTITDNTIAGVNFPLILDTVSGATIQRNNIGVSAAGVPLATSASLSYEGIALFSSDNVTIGSATTADDGNVIGGQTCSGVSFYGASSTLVGYNHIGVAADGTTRLGTAGVGVLASGSPTCAAPSSLALKRAKRGAAGTRIASRATATTGNTFVGNTISYNGSSGIRFDPGQGSSGNDIELNTISGNGGSGIALRDPAGVGNTILTNTIFGNSPKNIELYLDPTTPSLPLADDVGDVDGGANDGLNYPIINSVVDDGTNTTVTYTLVAPAGTPHDFLVQFFTTPGDFGKPGGENFLGQETRLGVLDNISFSKTFPSGLNYFSLTSTMLNASSGRETSEFSPVGTATPVPNVTVSPASFDFGNVEAGDITQPFTTFSLTSSGTAPWTLNGFAAISTCDATVLATPPCGGNFVCTTTCTVPSTFSAGGGCNVGAQFSPNSPGASSVTITVCDNTAPATPKTITLMGNAVLPPPVTVTPNGYDFGTVLVGASSVPQTFTVTNPAKSNVTLATPSATPPFSVVSTTCTSALPPAGTCNIVAGFTPATAGVASGQVGVTFTSNATGTPTTATAAAAVAGVGATVIQLALPASLDVGTFTLGLPAPVATAKLTNTGAAPAALTGISATSPFTLTHDCPATLAPGASCTLTLSLAGSTVGPATGSVSLSTASGVQRMALTGEIAQPAIAMSPASIDFGVVQVSHVSAIREVAIINTTSVDVPISAPAISGPFRIGSSSCASPLPAHTQCSVQTQFAPGVAGAATGALSLTFGVGPAASATSTSLSGTAMDIASLDMASLVEFGAYVVGSPAIVRTVTLTSSGNVAVNFAEISVSGPFALTHDCPAMLAPGASCTLTLSFSSSTLGSAAGLVSIRSNAVGGLRTISLGALVQARPVPVIEVSPVSISFGNRIFGNESAPVTVTVTNSGSELAVLGALGVGPSFLLKSNTCGPTLAPGASCSASVAMLPTAFGSLGSALAFTSNAEHSPHSVSLDGKGCRPVTPVNNRSGSGADPCSP